MNLPEFKARYDERQPVDRWVRELRLSLSMVTFDHEDFADLSDEHRRVIMRWLMPRTIELKVIDTVAENELNPLVHEPRDRAEYVFTMHKLALVQRMVKYFEAELLRVVDSDESKPVDPNKPLDLQEFAEILRAHEDGSNVRKGKGGA